MSAIRVGIINPSQSEKTNIEAPDNVKVGEVVGDIVEALQLPVNGPNGRPNRYQLNLRQPDGRLTRLDEGQSLAENGVQQDAILQLTVEMVGGFASGATASFHICETREIVIMNLKGNSEQYCKAVVSGHSVLGWPPLPTNYLAVQVSCFELECTTYELF